MGLEGFEGLAEPVELGGDEIVGATKVAWWVGGIRRSIGVLIHSNKVLLPMLWYGQIMIGRMII